MRILPELWVSREGGYGKVPVAEYPPLTRQMEAFLEAIRKDQEPPVPGEMGRAVMAVALAVEESSRKGRAVLLEGQG